MRSSATRGTGQLRLNVLTSAIMVVSGARAFGRFHGRAQRIFRRALYHERRAFVWFLKALQNHPADAFRRLARGLAGKWKASVGIVLLKASTELKSARGDFAEPSPLPRADLEHFRNGLLRRTVPFPAHRASILILDFVPPFFQLAGGHENAFENIERLKSSHDDGDFVLRGNREILVKAHDRADVAGGEKSLHHAV